MSSINHLIVHAEELGSFAADRLHGLRAGIIVIPESNGHHPGNGVLVVAGRD